MDAREREGAVAEREGDSLVEEAVATVAAAFLPLTRQGWEPAREFASDGYAYAPPRLANNHPHRHLMTKGGEARFAELRELATFDGSGRRVGTEVRAILGAALPDASPWGPKLRSFWSTLAAGLVLRLHAEATSARRCKWVVTDAEPGADGTALPPERIFGLETVCSPLGVHELVGDVRTMA